MNTQIIKFANNAFSQGDYLRAKKLYQQAANKYGHHLFAANLALCERRLQSSTGRHATAALGQQLAETQRLLEQYYNLCQELEYQLMDH